jgi:hypothetical protein
MVTNHASHHGQLDPSPLGAKAIGTPSGCPAERASGPASLAARTLPLGLYSGWIDHGRERTEPRSGATAAGRTFRPQPVRSRSSSANVPSSDHMHKHSCFAHSPPPNWAGPAGTGRPPASALEFGPARPGTASAVTSQRHSGHTRGDVTREHDHRPPAFQAGHRPYVFTPRSKQVLGPLPGCVRP